MLNYSEGAMHCKANSERLQASAEIILKNEIGTDSFGIFLYYIAYEEIAKAVYCLFVHRKWVDETFVKPIFDNHKYKIFLYDEIINSFEIKNGERFLGGKRLGELELTYFVKIHKQNIKEHRDITNDFLYVDKNTEWKVPEFINTKKENIETIKNKISALHNFFHFIFTKKDESFEVVTNFKFQRKDKGTFSMSYDYEK